MVIQMQCGKYGSRIGKSWIGIKRGEEGEEEKFVLVALSNPS